MSVISCEMIIRNRLLDSELSLKAQGKEAAPLAVFELGISGFMQTAQAARLREMARDIKGPQVQVHDRASERYNRYTLTERGRELAQSEKHIFDDLKRAAEAAR